MDTTGVALKYTFDFFSGGHFNGLGGTLEDKDGPIKVLLAEPLPVN